MFFVDYPFGIFKLLLFHDISLIYPNKHDILYKKNLKWMEIPKFINSLGEWPINQ